MKCVKKSGNMRGMKKFILFLVCAVLLIGAVRVLSLRYQETPEDFSGIQEWIDIGKEKVEEVTDRFSANVSDQDWELEGNYDINTESWFDSEGEIYSGSLEMTKLSEGEIKHLTLQAAGCKVILLNAEEADFYFSFENMKKVQAYQKGTELFVKVVRDTILDEAEEKNVLTLYVPRGYFLETAELELGAGGMHIEELLAQEVDLSVEAGKLDANFLKTAELEVYLGAGSVNLNNVEVQNAAFSVGAGSMTMDGQISGNAEANCAAGSLKMNLFGTVKDFNYKLQCMAGTILLNEEKYSGVNETVRMDNASEKSMELSCAVGSMKVTFKEN